MIEQKVPALQAGFVTSFETSALFDWKSRLGRMHSAEIWSFPNDNSCGVFVYLFGTHYPVVYMPSPTGERQEIG